MATLSGAQLSQLALCAKSGMDNVDSALGCYAVDPANYDEFATFFDRVCEAYHHGGGKIHETSWSLDGVAGLPADGVLDLRKLGFEQPLSMRVRVGRNLTSFPLPGLMTKSDRVKFEKTMLKAFDVLKADPKYGGNVYSLTPDDDWSEIVGEGKLFLTWSPCPAPSLPVPADPRAVSCLDRRRYVTPPPHQRGTLT